MDDSMLNRLSQWMTTAVVVPRVTAEHIGQCGEECSGRVISPSNVKQQVSLRVLQRDLLVVYPKTVPKQFRNPRALLLHLWWLTLRRLQI
jgi:hypothetical protein